MFDFLKIFKEKKEKEEKRKKLESDLKIHEESLTRARITLNEHYESLVKEINEVAEDGSDIIISNHHWELKKMKIAKYQKCVIECEHDIDRIKRELEEL
jgi:hypothetical protein